MSANCVRTEHNESGCYEGDGPHIHSDLNGLHNAEAVTTMIDWLEAKGKGQRQVNYRLRDCLSHVNVIGASPSDSLKTAVLSLVPEDQSPLRLPVTDKIQPSTGESPLAAIEDWVNVVDPARQGVKVAETNTMPQWAGSSWYYLLLYRTHEFRAPADPDVNKWAAADLYIGAQNTLFWVLLLYARFSGINSSTI